MEPVPDSIGIGSINYAIPGIGPTRSFVTRSITTADAFDLVNVCMTHSINPYPINAEQVQSMISCLNYHLLLQCKDKKDE